MEILTVLFGAILGTIFSIITTIVVESFRRPILEVKINQSSIVKYHDSEKKPAQTAKFLYVDVKNQPLPKIFSWLSRNPAVQCHGNIKFFHMDGQNVFGRSMPIRWTNLPNPIPLSININNNIINSFDPRKFEHSARVDLYPGEKELINVVARFDDEENCYGWTNESFYKVPIWRHTDWELQKGRYLVEINIFTAGTNCKKLFRLINDVNLQGFRLEEALPSDKIF